MRSGLADLAENVRHETTGAETANELYNICAYHFLSWFGFRIVFSRFEFRLTEETAGWTSRRREYPLPAQRGEGQGEG